ncbi:DUF2987 domain-containing protein [uncultured Shewanella sp.]|uniref:DUF2987 domain-containing protein n=1 Tax=uncultured Shewanella sp. TaxID=173975 RepID=UPI00260F98E3|nr:DUF2987 domain-containing protein [uncultured Shewanella sp.]
MKRNQQPKGFLQKGLLLSCVTFTSIAASAASFSLEYQGFYQRLKKVEQGHFQLVDMAFFVPNKQECRIMSGNISTEKHSYPLTYNNEQQLYLPFDARLKSDRALINMEIEGDVKHCGIMMQVRVKHPKKAYKADSIKQIQNEMNGLLKSMQGFPMKYFFKPISGLNIEFDEPTQVSIDGIQVFVGEKFHLGHKKIEQLSTMTFSHEPKLMSPWFESDKS